MANALVNDWIARGSGYKDGLAILKKLNPNAFIIPLLQSGETSFTKNKLKEALLAFQAPDTKKEPCSSLHSTLEDSTPSSNMIFQSKQVKPPLIQELEGKSKELYKLSNSLRLQLLHEPSQAKRRDMAFEILENMDTVYECYEVMDHYRDRGVLPVPDVPVKVSLRDLIQKEANLHTYITKYKKLVAGCNNASLLAKYSKKLIGFENELEQVGRDIDVLDKRLTDGLV